jgi:hypothetical protein
MSSRNITADVDNSRNACRALFRLRKIVWRCLLVARQRLGAVDLALLPTLAFVLGPLAFLNFAPPFLERVLILCQALLLEGQPGRCQRTKQTSTSTVRPLTAQ